MKYTCQIFFLSQCLILIILQGCSSLEDQYIELRNNLVGTWKIEHSIQEIRVDTVYAENTFEFTIKFKNDGTGSYTNIVGGNVPFEWYYQYTPEQFVLVYYPSNNQPNSNEYAQTYEVLTNKADHQIWMYKVIDLNAVADAFINTWDMTRE